MKTIVFNNEIFTQVKDAALPTTIPGAVAIFRDVDEIPEEKTIKESVEVSATENGLVDVDASDYGVDGIAKVTVNVDIEGEQVERTITSNGPLTINVPGKLMSDVILDVNVPTGEDVNVEPQRTFAIDHNGTTHILPTEGYDAMAKVSAIVNVPTPVSTPEIDVSETGWIHVTGDNIVTTDHKLSIEDDAQFKAENIKEGINIFGIDGTFSGGGGATWTDISSDCYVVGNGTTEIDGTAASTIDANVSDTRAILVIKKQSQRGVYVVKRDPITYVVGDGIVWACGLDCYPHSGAYYKLVLGCTQSNSTSGITVSAAYSYTTAHYAMKSPSGTASFKVSKTYKVYFMPFTEVV